MRSMRMINRIGLTIAIASLLASACGREDVRNLDPTMQIANVETDAGPTQADDAMPNGYRDAQPQNIDTGPRPPFDSGPDFFDSGPLPPGDADVPPQADAEPSTIPDAQPPFADANEILDASPPNNPDATSPPVDGGSSPTDAGPMPECMSDQDCAANEVCEPSLQVCVECYQNGQCGFGQVCDTMNGNICRSQCFGGNRCRPGQVCDTTQNLCVECLSSSDCSSDEICDVTSLSCVECLMDSDCASSPGQPFCALSENICVECLSNADCTAPDTCDTNSECTRPSNRPLCEPCNDDSQCGGANDLCIGYIFGSGNYVDQTCSQDCTNTPCPRGFECISTRSGSARQCRPEYDMQSPTCEAIRNLGSACPYSRGNLDPGCGISNFQDARCVQDSSTSMGGLCVIWCQNNDHCPTGFNCVQQPSAGQGYCL